jgi:hypothetical protein
MEEWQTPPYAARKEKRMRRRPEPITGPSHSKYTARKTLDFYGSSNACITESQTEMWDTMFSELKALQALESSTSKAMYNLRGTVGFRPQSHSSAEITAILSQLMALREQTTTIVEKMGDALAVVSFMSQLPNPMDKRKTPHRPSLRKKSLDVSKRTRAATLSTTSSQDTLILSPKQCDSESDDQFEQEFCTFGGSPEAAKHTPPKRSVRKWE